MKKCQNQCQKVELGESLLLINILKVLFVFLPCWADETSEVVLVPPEVPTPTVETEELKPLWEAGFGTIGIWTPDYPGAEQGKDHYIPAPWFYYRGPIFRADEDGGFRGRFVNQSRWEMDLSLGASFPADAEDNKARKGMEDLDWIFEIGPKAVYFIHPRSSENRFTFQIPFHIVSSTDFGRVDGRGYLTEPYISYLDKIFLHPSLAAGYFMSATFGTRQLNEYFYEVSPEEVLPDRPVYRAKGGYMGAKFGFRLFWQTTRNVRLFAAYSGSSYEGVANAESPLLKKTWTNAGAIGFLWRFYESDSRGYQ